MIPRFLLRCICLSAALGWLLGVPLRCPGHEFEDGFVERSVQYIVQDDQLIVEYSVGLNPATMSRFLEQWASGEDSADPDVLARVGGPDWEGEISPAEAAEIEQRFREQLAERLAANLELSLNGDPLQLRPEAVHASPRHHVIATVEWRTTLPAGEGRLKAIDQNFPNAAGGVRYALRVRGHSLLKSSSAEPSLVRADRVEPARLKEDARIEVTSVIGQVVVRPGGGTVRSSDQ